MTGKNSATPCFGSSLAAQLPLGSKSNHVLFGRSISSKSGQTGNYSVDVSSTIMLCTLYFLWNENIDLAFQIKVISWKVNMKKDVYVTLMLQTDLIGHVSERAARGVRNQCKKKKNPTIKLLKLFEITFSLL